MKKHRSGSAGTSRSSSKGGFSFGKSSGSGGTASSGKKPFFSGSGLKMKSARRKSFVKPGNDPGPKVRDGSGGLLEENPSGEQTGVVQQALQSTGCGCCSSIAGMIWLMVLGVIAVVVILALKCGGC
ncbi:MAG: hypothetical protein JXA64_00165 [Candidatus Fermentibacteraceae bacterium]|nr:hypothetical protein [Candidatus Fermentibacteraceae bacterium]MBN2607498.1 hypothetical protein [Candidatus Fermentibacteraceae bacterium]